MIDFLRCPLHVETLLLGTRQRRRWRKSTTDIADRRCGNTGDPSNFEPGTALENLRAEMLDIEALARAAEAAADGLPAPTTDRQRLAFGRIQSLATKTSQQASASLRFANAQVAALTAQMEARRKATTR